MTSFKKPPVTASIVCVLALAILCGLGTWQIKRLAWKTSLLDEIEAQYRVDREYIDFDNISDDVNFQRGFVYGHFAEDKNILIMPRTHDGAPGYHVLTPFLMGNGMVVMVNRGFLPLEKKDAPQSYSAPQGRVELTGALRRPETPNMFVPNNVPARDEWYRIDLEQITQSLGIKRVVPPFVFYMEQGVGAKSLPIATVTGPRLNNNHLQYAIFWFGMAFIALIIFFFRFIRRT